MDDAVAAVREAMRLHGIGVRQVLPAWAGREHHVCKVQLNDNSVVVAKVPRHAGFADPHWPGRTALLALQAEAEAVSRVPGLPVPHPVRLFVGPPILALLPLLPGSPPEKELARGRMDRRSLEAVCRAMGQAMAAVHRVKRPAGYSDITDLAGCDPATARLLHMDFHLGNVLGQRDLREGWRLTGIVDWTCCHWGPRETDLAELGSSFLATNPWGMSPFLLGYSEGSGMRLDRRRVERLIAAELVRRLDEVGTENPALQAVWELRVSEWGP